MVSYGLADGPVVRMVACSRHLHRERSYGFMSACSSEGMVVHVGGWAVAILGKATCGLLSVSGTVVILGESSSI